MNNIVVNISADTSDLDIVIEKLERIKELQEEIKELQGCNCKIETRELTSEEALSIAMSSKFFK